MFILDLHPVAPVLCVVCSHDIAEQVTKASKSFPYSIPKAPTTRVFEGLFGPRSIITAEVCLGRTEMRLHLACETLILTNIGRGMEVTP